MLSQHASMPMPMSEGNSWLPLWLRLVGVAAFVVVAAVHLWHLRATSGRVRAWHIGHVVMALGMIAMFAPSGTALVPAAAGETVFGVTTLLALTIAIVSFATRHRDWLWPVAAVDHATMIYMFGLATLRLSWLTWLLVAWFVAQAAAWVTGWLTAMDYEQPVPVATAITTGASSDTTTQSGTATITAPQLHGTALRATLVTMNLGMAYMLVAMWLGMPPGMPTM